MTRAANRSAAFICFANLPLLIVNRILPLSLFRCPAPPCLWSTTVLTSLTSGARQPVRQNKSRQINNLVRCRYRTRCASNHLCQREKTLKLPNFAANKQGENPVCSVLAWVVPWPSLFRNGGIGSSRWSGLKCSPARAKPQCYPQ